MTNSNTNIYRACRLAAGMTMEEASEKLHIGLRTLSNYELDVTIPPYEIVSSMQKEYGAGQAFIRDYLRQFPYIKTYIPEENDKPLPETALRMYKEVTDIYAMLPRVVAITFDNQIDETERPEWYTKVVPEMEEAIESLRNMVLYDPKEKPSRDNRFTRTA